MFMNDVLGKDFYENPSYNMHRYRISCRCCSFSDYQTVIARHFALMKQVIRILQFLA